ncbi:membrane protein [Streptomyces viridochromogenes]|uniref:Membrane protein n=1 Tax=Streptomyces viridochromogenes TaxID=1938 RepID=A0A0J7ZKS5_STRVR|nr:hypothetical protein [Streptomyces viridochromogenes]KMS75748.1 membrane protein [Streptomyces viridochromogenes]KOG16949.1 membrane protein [Streptomyces viridochromogenes]KOG18244.1 membrane protein [Streptomyces viridochromogenes]
MAGTDEEAVAAADDALYVLTAVLLTPAKFPSVLGDDYPEACAALGLAPLADGYGLVLGQDGDGARWTVVIDDVSLVAVAIASWDCGMEYDLSPDERTVVAALPGWPLAVAVAAPNVPEPHDPDPEVADGPALTPPDTSVWGPAQRRLGADEIALQWAMWREQIDDTDFATPGGGAADATEGTDTGEREGAGAEPGEKGENQGGHTGIRRVLTEARAYVDSPPPLGRVRSSFAPGDARTLRADGPGWSLVARTDDIAFVLLDDEPGEVLPVGRGPELPGLLEALDKMAVRPS